MKNLSSTTHAHSTTIPPNILTRDMADDNVYHPWQANHQL